MARGNTYILEIQEIFPEDSGTYTCEAFNDAGECFSTATLNVSVPGEPAPPLAFKAFPRSLTVSKGEAASFVASLAASLTPDTKVTWMKDGKVVGELPLKIKINQSGAGLLSLEVKDCSGAVD